MKPQTKAKLNARAKYWGLVHQTQMEFVKQFIHSGLRPKEICQETLLSKPTVDRFLETALGNKKRKNYSYSHGPYSTTLFAIADSLGFHFKAVKKNGK